MTVDFWWFANGENCRCFPKWLGFSTGDSRALRCHVILVVTGILRRGPYPRSVFATVLFFYFFAACQQRCGCSKKRCNTRAWRGILDGSSHIIQEDRNCRRVLFDNLHSFRFQPVCGVHDNILGVQKKGCMLFSRSSAGPRFLFEAFVMKKAKRSRSKCIFILLLCSFLQRFLMNLRFSAGLGLGYI